MVGCRGCGKQFRFGREWNAHKRGCYQCGRCGHGFSEKVRGCECCATGDWTWRPEDLERALAR